MSGELTYALTILTDGRTGPDGSILAEPLGDKAAVDMGAADAGPALFAPCFVAGPCASSFDLFWDLERDAALPPWSAAVVLSQSGGRGQLRREWLSPPGNLYVSWRLPENAVRLGNPASLAVGYLVHAALSDMGFAVALKWPNDILFQGGKAGGILLEERNGVIAAGLGLNLASAPENGMMREGRAAPPAVLTGFAGTVCGLWRSLVTDMRARWDALPASPDSMAAVIETALAWRGVGIHADEPGVTGVLAGLAADGSLLVRTEAGIMSVSSGSIRLADAAI